MYDHKPSFEEGQRLFHAQKNTGPATPFNHPHKTPTEHIGYVPATTYAPQLHSSRRFSPGDIPLAENDGECIHSNVIAEGSTAEMSKERILDDRPLLLARGGSEHALHSMHAPCLPTEQNRSAQLTDILYTKSSSKDVAVPSTKDVSNFDDDNEHDEEQDRLAGDREFKPPTHPLGKHFNRLDFARVYSLVALRVSLAECESLAYRLKGHLLNWPRISNIARVDGDDMDWAAQNSLTNGKEQRVEGIEDSLRRAVYGSAASSGPLAKRHSAAGKISSRHSKYLESLSRPGRMVMKEMQKEVEVHTIKQSPKKYYMVELEDSQEERVGFDIRLEGLEFGMKKWRGPFRLLLLDTKYAGQPASKLPMAVQIALKECEGHRKWGPRREIVPCKLTLFYAYWSMEEILNHILLQEESMRLRIKIMGHIAVLSLGERHHSVKFLIGKVVLDKHRPKVKTVINKLDALKGNCCPDIEILAGNHSVVTTIAEDGMRFLVNLATVYWDSELASERHRLIQQFSKKDIVCDIFAGSGPLSLIAAKKVWRVFSNDENREALKYLARNVADNRLQAKVELYNLDRRVFIRKLLAFKSPVFMTQVIFALPTSGDTILDVFKGAFNRRTWPAMKPLPRIHVYGYSNTANPDTDFLNVIVFKLGLESEAVEVHHVKEMESGRWLVCANFQLPAAVAFDD